MSLTKEKPLKDMTERELRDKGMKAIEGMRELYNRVDEKRRGVQGIDIPADLEEQVDKFEQESRAVEQEVELRRKQALFEKDGPKIPGTDTQSDEKYDPNFKPDRRSISNAITNVQKRGLAKVSKNDAKIFNLAERESEIFEKAARIALTSGKDEVRSALSDEEFAIFQNQQARDKEQRVGQQSTSTTAGGYTIPQGFIPEVVRFMKYISVFFDEFQESPTAEAQSLFTVYKTDSGNDLPMPTNDDTSNTGELLAENSDGSTSTADLVFGQVTMKAYKYSTKMIKSSTELLQDSAINLPALIGENFGSRIGRIVNSHFTTGTNSSQPQGIVTAATSGKVTASATAVTFPEIIDLVHSLDPSYRNRPSVRFMLHDNILAYLKKLTVGSATNNARPLWAPGYDVSAPPTIDGYRYLINQSMASTVTTGQKIMLFADMKAYAIRLVNQYRLLTLRERYAEFDQTAWIGFMRADGRALNTSAIKFLRTT